MSDRRRWPRRSGPADVEQRGPVGWPGPTSRKTTAVSRNAMNSQTVSIASGAVRLGHRRGRPKLPRMTAADDRGQDSREAEVRRRRGSCRRRATTEIVQLERARRRRAGRAARRATTGDEPDGAAAGRAAPTNDTPALERSDRRRDDGEGDREQDEPGAVVEQALAIDQRRQRAGRRGCRLKVATTAAGSVADTDGPPATIQASSRRQAGAPGAGPTATTAGATTSTPGDGQQTTPARSDAASQHVESSR